MFTGIVEKLGTCLARSEQGSGLSATVRIELETGWKDLSLGESVAVRGACLTVAELTAQGAVFVLGPETLAKTTLGLIQVGTRVHLERALRLGDRLSGHWVQGHVDGCATVLENTSLGDCTTLRLQLPAEMMKYCIVKGSITVDGVSLTIHECGSDSIALQIVPHTLKVTALGDVEQDDRVHIEVDVLAKYVEKLTENLCFRN